ncbi:unnamed protein product [Closterium sp. NIES-54]
MYALSFRAEGHCFRCVPPDPGIAAAAPGASASGTPPGTKPAEALHTFTLDSGASRCFFRDSTTLTPLPAPIPVRLADPSGGPVVARSSTVLPCPAVAASCSFRLLSHQNLLWHHRLGHPSLPRLRGMHSRHLVSGLPRPLPPLPPSPAPPCLPCVEGRQRAAPHSSFPPTTAPLQTLHMDQFGHDLRVLRLHSDRGGEFSSNLLRDFCRGEGILQSGPLTNGIAERRIGLVMEVAHTSMIGAAAPHFLCPFAIQYAAHQLNLWPRVSLLKTSPTLRWMGKVGDASVFWVWGSRAFVRNMSTDKLSARAIPCVFLGSVLDAPGWQFYHPTSRHVLPSQDVTFDESVPFYRLFPYHSAPPPPPPLFLAPGPPLVDPLPPQGPSPSSVSQVDPLPSTTPVEVAVGLGAAPGAASVGAEPGVAGSEGAGSGGAGSGGAEPEGVEPWGAGDTRAGGAAVTAGAGGTGGTVATSPGGARTSGAGAAGTGGVGCAGAGDPMEPGAAGAGGAGVGVAGVGGLAQEALGLQELELEALAPEALGLQELELLILELEVLETQCGRDLRRDTERRKSRVCTARHAPRSRPPPVLGTNTMALRPSSVPLRVPLPAPRESSLPEVPDPAFDRAHAASPTIARLLATVVTDPSFESAAASALVAELLDFSTAPNALGTEVLEDRQEDFECLVAIVPRFASMLLAPEGDPDAPDIPSPRSYAEAIAGTYVDEVPPSRANIVDGMSIFRVKRPPGSPPAFKARYVARGFSQRQGADYFQTFSPTLKMTTLWVLLHVAAQRDYELHSLDFSTSFLQGSLHEEIWLRRPPGFTGTFPAGTQWSLRRPVYGIRQAPREWHDTLRTTLAALGFAPSTADPSLFLRTDSSLSPFYVLVYLGLPITRDRAQHTITLTQSHMVHLVLQRFGFTWSSSPQPTPLSTSHSLSAPPSDESVEPSGPYPELVGCHMHLMTCTRSDLAYPLSLLARYVAPDRHRKVHWDAAKRLLHYLCCTSCMGLMLGGRGPVVLTGYAYASWELRWLTYLLTDLGEQPRSPLVLYVDNKAMIALCQEHRLEHRTKHIALRYFLVREMQQRGQLRLAYITTRANTADVFTKALPPGDHQRFATVLGLVPTLPHLLSA